MVLNDNGSDLNFPAVAPNPLEIGNISEKQGLITAERTRFYATGKQITNGYYLSIQYVTYCSSKVFFNLK